MTVSSRLSEHPAGGARLQRDRGAARVVLLREDHETHLRIRRAHAGDQRDPVDQAVLVAGLHGHGRPAAGRRAAQVGVDEQHVEPPPLRGRPFQAAQRGRAAAGRRHLDVRLGGQGRGQ
jgi:hypothetical protein